MKKGILKHVISQNIDNLHIKSGIPPHAITEIHGNRNIEYCEKCENKYIRDYLITRPTRGSNETGRKCSCGTILKDSVINFGESLDFETLSQGSYHHKAADLMLALGSSLRVFPACGLAGPNEKSKMVIVNLQKTPMDEDAEFVIHAKIDTVFEMLM